MSKSLSPSNSPETARWTQSVGVPLTTRNLRSSKGSTRSGMSSVSELLAPLRLRSGATTVMSASGASASPRARRPSAR